MKITAERTYLHTAVSAATRAISGRNTLPVLANVLIEAEDDRIKFTATDLDTAIISTIPAMIQEAGSATLPAAALADILAKLPNAPVTIEVGESTATIRSGKSDYTLLVIPAEDYPVVPAVTDGWTFSVTQSQLKALLHHTTFAASKEETRSILMGVLVEAGRDKLTLVCTDTHRLAKMHGQVQWNGDAPTETRSTIIPARPLAEVEKLIRDSDEERVFVTVGPSQVCVSAGDVTLISRLMDGTYPNYEKVIPKNPERTVTFRREALLDALQRVNIVAQHASQKAIFTISETRIEIAAESQDVGKGYEEIACSLDGTGIKIAFNAGYLLQVLTLLDGEDCVLSLSGALSPGLLRVAGNDAFLYVVMPMQV